MTSRRAAAAPSNASASSCSRRCGSAGAAKIITLRGSSAIPTSVPARPPSAEQVLGARTQEGGGAGTVVGGDVALEPAHDDRRLARVLVAHEVGGGRGLVGDGDPRGAQLTPRAVAPASPVLERPQPGHA